MLKGDFLFRHREVFAIVRVDCKYNLTLKFFFFNFPTYSRIKVGMRYDFVMSRGLMDMEFVQNPKKVLTIDSEKTLMRS